MLEYDGSKCVSKYIWEQLSLILPLTVLVKSRPQIELGLVRFAPTCIPSIFLFSTKDLLATETAFFVVFGNEMVLIGCLALAVLDFDICQAHNSKNCCFSNMTNWLNQCSCSMQSVVRSDTFHPLPYSGQPTGDLIVWLTKCCCLVAGQPQKLQSEFCLNL